jgi:hypothetical protein
VFLGRLAVVLWVILLAFSLADRAHAATYYVSPAGDDTRVGTSPGTAWHTLAKVNNTNLQPGDSILLEGGKSFEGPLVPWGSGRADAPIAFSSYGTGRATISSQTNNIVFLHGVSWVTIQNLRLTADGADMHVIVSDPTTTSAYVTIKNNLITDTAAFGINAPSLSDHDWTIQGNTVSEAGETGITFRGSKFSVIGNVIQDTGLHPGEAAHGVYAKGPGAQVIGNVITNFAASGVSIRYRNSVVRGNAIGGGLIGVGSFQEDKSGGISTIAYNRISNVSLAGIYLDGSSLESFVIANNTIRTTAGSGLNLHRVKSLTLVNNVVTGAFDDYIALLWKSRSLYVEHHNLWFPGTGSTFLWEGAARTLDGYRSASRQGTGDLTVDPQLDGSLVPRASSPVIDAGVVVSGLGYHGTCNGTAFSYCDRTPDLGAVERKRRKRRSVRR